VLSTVIKSYDILATVRFFIIDNASNNNTCIKELAKQYPTVTQQSRLQCVSYILNLIVKALLFVMGGKRPANEYAFAPMYRKRRVASSSYGIYPPYASTKIDKREVLRRSLLWHLGVAPYTL
jgi:hypothetical protein